MRILVLLFLLLSFGAWAQPSGGGGGPGPVNPCPGNNCSNTNVTATGSTTARTLAARAADVVNAADYGFAPGASGATNRAALQAAINQACTAQTFTMLMPAGHYTVDVSSGEIVDSCGGTNQAVSLLGSAYSGTFLAVTTGGNNIFHIEPPGGQPNTGLITISGFIIYVTDNASSGAALALDRTSGVLMSDLEIGGSFTDVDCISCVSTTGTNLVISGNNSSAGASLMRFRRSSNLSTNINTSQNFFSNSEIAAGTLGGYANSVVINDADGIWFVGNHLGFNSSDVVYIQPEFNASGGGTTSDDVDGIHFIGTDFDGSTGGNCVNFQHLSGFSGTAISAWFTGGSCFNAGQQGVLIDDVSWSDIIFSGFSVNSTQDNGFYLENGSYITLYGGHIENYNLANNGSLPIKVGSSTQVSAIMPTGSGTPFVTDGGQQANISDTGSAVNYLNLSGSATGNGPVLSVLGSDTNINILLQPKGTGNVVVNSGILLANNGIQVGGFTNILGGGNLGSASTNYLTYSGQGSGGSPSLLSTGGDTNITLTLGAKGTGSVTAKSALVVGQTKYTSTGCSISSTTGSGTAGNYTSGTTGTCTAVITMNGASGMTAPNGWNCTAADWTTPANTQAQTASTQTTATIAGTTVSGDVVHFACQAY